MSSYQTFPQFERLPPELQLQIWQAAIRPDRPGVQHLEIRVLNEPDEEAPDWHDLDVPGSNLFADANENLWATQPREEVGRESDFQRIRRAKSSAYFFDAGLLTACRASRRAIVSHVRQSHFAPLILQFQPERYPDLVVRVDSREDLFIIEIYKFGNYTDSWDKLFRDMSYFDVLDLCRDMEANVAQVAFEFDPSWLVDLPEEINNKDPPFDHHPCHPFVHYLVDWILRGRLGQLWLIDPSIKRRSGTPRSAARFHGTNTSYHRILANEVPDGSLSAFTFIRALGTMVHLDFGEFSTGTNVEPIKFADIWVLECREL